MLLAVLMTKHLGMLEVLKELALVLTCLKPGVEVWRLAHGAERDPGAPSDPKEAMMIGKIAERVFESIPGAILTTVTLLDHAEPRRRALALDGGVGHPRVLDDSVRRDDHRVQ